MIDDLIIGLSRSIYILSPKYLTINTLIEVIKKILKLNRTILLKRLIRNMQYNEDEIKETGKSRRKIATGKNRRS
jgi:hypothetical protein